MAKAKKPQMTPLNMTALLNVLAELRLGVSSIREQLGSRVTVSMHNDLVRMVAEIDKRTREMRSIQYAPTPPGLQPGQAPPCAKCGAHRDAMVHIKSDMLGYHRYTTEQRLQPAFTVEDFFSQMMRPGKTEAYDTRGEIQRLHGKIRNLEGAAVRAADRIAALENAIFNQKTGGR